MEEVVLLKIESIEKCVNRVAEKAISSHYDFEDYDTQDVVVLNL